MTVDLKKLAESQQEWAVGVRRELHACPELRWEEGETLRIIRAYVDGIVAAAAVPWVVQVRELRGGLVVDITVDPTLERRLFRADVDALPIPEETGLPFASTNGNSHACGHDMHAAMLLGFFRAMMEFPEVGPKHNLRLVWQRAEENPITPSGGNVLVNEENVCEGIARAFGLHVWSDRQAGTFYSRPGAILANSDRFQVEIACKGGHVMEPQSGSNAIDVAVDIVCALRGFDRRYLGPMEPCSLVPAVFTAGSASNIRPDTARQWFAARNFLPEDRRTAFESAIRREVEAVVARYPDASGKVTYVRGHPSTINDDAAVEYVASLLMAAEQTYQQCEPDLGGEDFAHYLQKVPGAFVLLGAGSTDAHGHHTSKFNPSEDVMPLGVHYWLLLATS